MIYVEELTLKDFQTHKNTTIKFSPYFNVVIGSTRSGKSSMVRGLDFLLYNNWYEDYQRFGSSHTDLVAKLSNGKTLIRTKSDKVNKIAIIEGKDIKRFEGFGHTLPDEAVRAMGVIPIDIGTKDPILANVANQDDPLFLLYCTGTDRTKVLSRLSGLHWLDYALKDLNGSRLTNSKFVQHNKDGNTQLLEKLNAFKNLDSIRNNLIVEKERLSKLKHIDDMVQVGRMISNKAVLWKRDYQEIQNLKKINFSEETKRLERLIQLSEILQPLKEAQRKLKVNDHSLGNVRLELHLSIDVREEIEKEIAKVNICEACGQEIQKGVLHEQEHK